MGDGARELATGMSVGEDKIKRGLHYSISRAKVALVEIVIKEIKNNAARVMEQVTCPTGPALRTSLSRSSPSIRTLTPWLTVPRMFSLGTKTLSKINSPVLEPRIPSLSSLRAQENPEEVLLTMNAVMPLEPLLGSVFAYTTMWSASGP